MNNRRKLLVALGAGALAAPLGALAQQAQKLRRIGILLTVSAGEPEFQRRISALSKELGELGWAEGRTFAFAARYAEGKPERLPALATELVNANVDVIVTQGSEGTDAARGATSVIPIVMASIGDAVGQGIVASLARPGGNVTGLSLFATEQGAKRLQLIKEISPHLARAAVIWNRNAAAHPLQLKGMRGVAQTLGIELVSFPVASEEDINAAFRDTARRKVQAVVTMDDPFIQIHRARIVELAMKQRLPVMGEFSPMTAAGGLMNYGPDQIDMWRQSAKFVDKILKGVKPGDLPIEQPTKFELVVNMKTAKALGITIPQSILVRADRVID